MPVGQQQECGDDQKANCQCKQLFARKKGEGITDQADEREGAYSSEGIRACGYLVLFPFQSYQER